MNMHFRFEAIEHDLQLDECLSMQAREWPFRVLAGMVILLAVLAAVLGWAGDGKLSIKEIHREGAVLQYPQVVRLGKEFALEIGSADQALAIHIPNDYLGRFRLRDVVPPPAQTQLSADGVTLRFDAGSPATVRFYFQPERMGRPEVHLQAGEQTFTFRQLVLP